MQLDLFNTLPIAIKAGGSKVCNKCNQELPETSFSFHGGANYLRPECKNCNNKLSKTRQQLRTLAAPPDANYKCPICLLNEEQTKGIGNKRNGSWVLDHDHTSKKFRGWLCHRCNRALGCFEDNVERMVRATDYLKRV